MTRSLGLDVGDKRIGVALSDPLGMLARPLLVIERRENEADIGAILQIAGQYQVEKIIIGLPQSMDGSFGAQAEKVRAFGELLRSESQVPVEFRDERLSTVSARRMIHEAGSRKPSRKKGEKGEYDAAAAAIILQTYLDESNIMKRPDGL